MLTTEETRKRLHDSFMPKLQKRAFRAFVFVILWLFVIVAAYTLDGSNGQKLISKVKSYVKDIIPIDTDAPPTSITAYRANQEYIYYGSEQKIGVTTTPYEANKDVILSTKTDAVELTENGYRVLTTVPQDVSIDVTSKDNPNATTNLKIYLCGIDPAYKHIEKREIYFGNNAADAGFTEIAVGKKTALNIYFTLTEEGNSLVPENERKERYRNGSGIKLLWNDGTENKPFYYNTNNKTITFTEECEGVLSVLFIKNSNGQPIDNVERLDVNVKASMPDVTYAPENKFELFTNLGECSLNDDGSYTYVWKKASTSTLLYVGAAVEEGKNNDLIIVPVGDAASGCSVSGNRIQRNQRYGSYEFDVYSPLMPDKPTRLIIKMEENIPTGLSIVSSGKVAVAGYAEDNTLSAKFDVDGKNYCKDVKWSILEGDFFAKINEKTGKLDTYYFGYVTVRAESEYYGLYAEERIQIKFFATLKGFTEKVLGHFTVYLIFGAALYVFFRYVMRRRTSAFLTSLAISLFCAIGTEVLQAFSDRNARPLDTLTNMLGATCGVILTVIIIAVFAIYTFITNRNKYEVHKKCIDEFTFEDLMLYRKKDF